MLTGSLRPCGCSPSRGKPIPRLILGRAEAIPLPALSVKVILVERTPLRTWEVLGRMRSGNQGEDA